MGRVQDGNRPGCGPWWCAWLGPRLPITTDAWKNNDGGGSGIGAWTTLVLMPLVWKHQNPTNTGASSIPDLVFELRPAETARLNLVLNGNLIHQNQCILGNLAINHAYKIS
jgi:hypothetical protein